MLLGTFKIMAKYRITAKGTFYIDMELEADSKEEAIELAHEEVHVSGYCGNGGCDKLIGVTDSDYGSVSIEADEYLEIDEDKVEQV